MTTSHHTSFRYSVQCKTRLDMLGKGLSGTWMQVPSVKRRGPTRSAEISYCTCSFRAPVAVHSLESLSTLSPYLSFLRCDLIGTILLPEWWIMHHLFLSFGEPLLMTWSWHAQFPSFPISAPTAFLSINLPYYSTHTDILLSIWSVRRPLLPLQHIAKSLPSHVVFNGSGSSWLFCSHVMNKLCWATESGRANMWKSSWPSQMSLLSGVLLLSSDRHIRLFILGRKAGWPSC